MMNFAKVLATSLGAPILIKAFVNCFSVHFSPLSITFAILAECFLIQAAAFKKITFIYAIHKNCNKNHIKNKLYLSTVFYITWYILNKEYLKMMKLFISLTIFSVLFAAGWSLDKIITSNTHHVTEKAITI